MKVEIITIGTELIMGQTINTNAAFLARSFASIGFDPCYQQVVDDQADHIEETLSIAEKRADLVVLAGGLGATHDDITKQVLADYLNQELVIDPVQWQYIQSYFKKQKRQITDLDDQQALTFAEGKTFHTQDGLACGSLFYQEQAATYFLCLPGPPSELTAMLNKEVLPYFVSHFGQQQVIDSLYLNFVGIGESQLASKLAPIIQALTNPSLAIYAKPRHVQVCLTTKSKDTSANQSLLNDTAKEIIPLLKSYYIGSGQSLNLETYLLKILQEQKWTLSCAESLTGGQVLGRLTRSPGSSQVIKGGFVVYQEQAKSDYLGIDPHLLDRFSVYSPECACAMAESCLRLSQTDFALSLTGVAGPGPDQGHPAGEVYLACASRSHETIWQKVMIPNRGRDYVRELAASYALELLKKIIEQKFAKELSLRS